MAVLDLRCSWINKTIMSQHSSGTVMVNNAGEFPLMHFYLRGL